MMEERFHPEAAEEFVEAAAWYEQKVDGLGGQFIEAVRAAIRNARHQPALGRPARAGCRRWLVKRFPYAVVYRATPDEFIIFAIMHGARRPYYWRNRIPTAG